MPTHSSILVWRIPWTEEPSRLQSVGSQRVGHNWATNTFFFNVGNLLFYFHTAFIGFLQMRLRGEGKHILPFAMWASHPCEWASFCPSVASPLPLKSFLFILIPLTKKSCFVFNQPIYSLFRVQSYSTYSRHILPRRCLILKKTNLLCNTLIVHVSIITFSAYRCCSLIMKLLKKQKLCGITSYNINSE